MTPLTGRARWLALVVLATVVGVAFYVIAGRLARPDDEGDRVTLTQAAAPQTATSSSPAVVGRAEPDPGHERFFARALDPAVAATSLIGNPAAAAAHARLTRDRRDPTWAAQAEALLDARLASGGADRGQVEAHCGASLCEVRMVAPQAIDGDLSVGQRAVEGFAARVAALAAERTGFRSDAQTFTTFSADRPDEVGVLAYFERNGS